MVSIYLENNNIVNYNRIYKNSMGIYNTGLGSNAELNCGEKIML